MCPLIVQPSILAEAALATLVAAGLIANAREQKSARNSRSTF